MSTSTSASTSQSSSASVPSSPVASSDRHVFDARPQSVCSDAEESETTVLLPKNRDPSIFAYCRVSTVDQDTTIQEEAIRHRFPSAIIRTEQASATSRDGRPMLDLLLQMIGSGDQLVVWKLDRLARNMRDLCLIVDELQAKGASLVILDQNIDTGTAAGRAFLQMLGVFAEFETNLRKERQLAGIAKAKQEGGKYRGRKAVFDADRIKALLAEGKLSHAAIAKAVGCSTKTVQRACAGV